MKTPVLLLFLIARGKKTWAPVVLFMPL